MPIVVFWVVTLSRFTGGYQRFVRMYLLEVSHFYSEDVANTFLRNDSKHTENPEGHNLQMELSYIDNFLRSDLNSLRNTLLNLSSQ